jgi:pantoate--beta-alanine ligase
MIVADTIETVRQAVSQARSGSRTIGLVPTMGALHAGHESLIRSARQETGFVVVSIFVNPIQFGLGEDLERYPRPLAQDLQICEEHKMDLVFHPPPAVMYPAGFRTAVEVQELQDILCGASRPGHFRGVATVVLKLFNIVLPDVAYFGQKDAQQARIIQQMVKDLNLPIRLKICPIVREPDGLALSSRNQYLSPAERERARVLHLALEEVRKRFEKGEREAPALRQVLATRIAATPGAVLDYAAVVDADTLKPISRLKGEVLVAVAVKLGSTRLIDNILLSVPEAP